MTDAVTWVATAGEADDIARLLYDFNHEYDEPSPEPTRLRRALAEVLQAASWWLRRGGRFPLAKAVAAGVVIVLASYVGGPLLGAGAAWLVWRRSGAGLASPCGLAGDTRAVIVIRDGATLSATPTRFEARVGGA